MELTKKVICKSAVSTLFFALGTGARRDPGAREEKTIFSVVMAKNLPDQCSKIQLSLFKAVFVNVRQCFD